jgi:protein gp37
MSTNTGIEWTDATWNPIRGCSRVSEGCRHCYAEVVAARFSGPGQAYAGLARRTSKGEARWTGKIMFVEKHLNDPLRWRKPQRIFVNSMSDLFHERVTDEQLDRIYAVMTLATRHTFQVLTKRPGRMRDYILSKLVDRRDRSTAKMSQVLSDTALPLGLAWPLCPTWPPPNVLLGVSAEDQSTADERIPVLMATPAAYRFVSHEPLLGPILLRWPVDWVIVGGESGPNARSCDVQWIRDIVRQCRRSGLPVFVKQLGAEPGFKLEDEERRGNPMPSFHHSDGDLFIKKLDDSHGGDPAEWPEELRVREFPKEAATV